MRTSPKTIACVAYLAIAMAACTSGAHQSLGPRLASTTTMTTQSPVDDQVLAAFRGALDVEYELGSQPAVAGDMQAANALSQDPRLAAAFTGVAYTQTWTGIASAHMNGIQGPATYEIAELRVTSLSPPSNPSMATVFACFFDIGNIYTATKMPVTSPPSAEAGWAFGTWTLAKVGPVWKVSDDNYQGVPTTDGRHPKCAH